MALLRKSRPEQVEEVAVQPSSLVVEAGKPVKKDRPTPKRRDAQKARMERLHPQLTPKQQRAADRAADNERRLSAQQAVEKTPERTLLRNFIDSGWHPAEFSMPVLLLGMAAIFLSGTFPQLMWPITIGMWALLVLVAVDIFLTWRKAKRVLRERLGTTNFRTLFTYTMNRMLQIRRFRQPPPVIKRGDAY